MVLTLRYTFSSLLSPQKFDDYKKSLSVLLKNVTC